MANKKVLVKLIVLVSVFELCVTQGVDRTLQREASGADVVRAVLKKIEGVFGRDNQFLRRVAFVESKDGADIDTFRSGYNGGIWQVDEIGFESTQDTNSHPRLRDRYQQIMAEFGIDWSSGEWRDLRIPLYSGLAARLFLLNIPAPIPCDVTEQAVYWKRYYNTASGEGTEQKFISDVNALNDAEGKWYSYIAS